MAFDRPLGTVFVPVEPPLTTEPDGEWAPAPLFDVEDLPAPFLKETP